MSQIIEEYDIPYNVLNIDLNEIISENFIDSFCEYTQCTSGLIVEKGGRMSGKSVNVGGIGTIAGVMAYNKSALVIIKYGNKIKDRLVDNFTECLRLMGVEKFWKLRRSPFEYVLLDEYGRETQVSIKFTGCDNAEIAKGVKPREGAFRYVWFEELTNFDSYKEVKSVIDTAVRGGEASVLFTYNPPMQIGHWVNKEFNVPCGVDLGYESDYYEQINDFEVDGKEISMKVLIHHSTYLGLIANGNAHILGNSALANIEKSRKENNDFYRWNYLGEVIGTDANVFKNIKDWDGDISELDIKQVHRGFDWGYGGPDPCAYSAVYYDKKNRALYILDEFGEPKMSVPQISAMMKQKNKRNFAINADSACPILNDQLITQGINIRGVKKGPNSVYGGILWLQSLNAIYICKKITPKHYKEFSEYSYKVNKDDEVTSTLDDKNNHWIDSTRYALADVIKYD